LKIAIKVFRKHKISITALSISLIIASSFALNSWYSSILMSKMSDDSPETAGHQPWHVYAADMIDLQSGNLFLSVEDLQISAKGFYLQLLRSYNSHLASSGGLFGNGWSFNYGDSISLEGTKRIFSEGDGSYLEFAYNGSNSFLSPAGYSNYRLYNWSNGYHSLANRDGWTKWFDDDGFLINVTSAEGLSIKLTYSSSILTKVEDSNGHWLSFTSQSGRIVTVKDNLLREWHFVYDLSGYLVRTEDPAGNNEYYSYDPSTGLLDSYTKIDGQQLLFNYDSSDRVTGVNFQLVNASRKTDLSAFRFFDISYGAKTRVLGPMGEAFKVEHDANGRVTTSTDPLDNSITRSWTADNQLSTFTNELGKTYTFYYDDHGNMIRAADPTGNQTFFNYTIIETPGLILNQLRNTTDARGHVTSYEYFPGTRLVKNSTDPSGNVTSYSYTGDGFLATLTDRCGNVQTYTYDSKGQLESYASPEGVNFLYDYDGIGRIINETVHDTASGKQSRSTL